MSKTRASGIVILFLVGWSIIGAEIAPEDQDPADEGLGELDPAEADEVALVEPDPRLVDLPNANSRIDGDLEVSAGVLPRPGNPEGFTPWEVSTWPGQPDLFEDLNARESGLILGGQPLFAAPSANDQILRNGLLPGGLVGPSLVEGFRFGAGVQWNYDSNVFLTDGSEVSDVFLTFSPSIDYRSAPAGVPGLFTVRYTPFIKLYLEESDLSTVDHSLASTISYAGANGSIQAAGNYGRFTHADRFAGGLVETENFSGSVSSSYQLGSRTSLEASWQGSFSEDSDREDSTSIGQSSDSRTSSLQVSGYWQATSKTRIGPSLRYSSNSSGTTGDRDSLAYLLVADHSPRDNLSLSASIGVEQADDPRAGGGSNMDFTGSLEVNYQPNQRMAFQATIRYEAIPLGNVQASRSGGGSQQFNGAFSFSYSPNPDWTFGLGATIDSFPAANISDYSIADQTYTASASRALAEGRISLSGSVSTSEYDSLGMTLPGLQEESDSRSVALRYQRPFGPLSLNASLRWSDSTGTRDWERIQAGFGLDVEF